MGEANFLPEIVPVKFNRVQVIVNTLQPGWLNGQGKITNFLFLLPLSL